MAVSATSHPTMVDYVNRLDRDGKIADIIEIIRQENQLADVIPWIECNDGDGHRTTMRTGLPTPTWRQLYGGVQPTKSETRQVRDTTGIMHAYAEVDVDLVEANQNSADWLLSENSAFVAGMNEEFMQTFFYGDEATEQEAFTGLSARYSSTTAENKNNVIKDLTGTPDTSLWVLGFGPQALHGVYPKGYTMGLKETYKGIDTIEDADGSGGRMEAHRTHYRWACGASLRDWRTCGRIQVDFADLTKNAASGANLYDLMSKMLTRTRRGMVTNKVIVCNEGVMEFLRLQAKYGTQNSTLSRTELAGREVESINGYPVLLCDALRYDENTTAPIV